jgi:hypothetical protein
MSEQQNGVVTKYRGQLRFDLRWERNKQTIQQSDGALESVTGVAESGGVAMDGAR